MSDIQANKDTAHASPQISANSSPKKRLVALVLCLFLGPFGVHRYYTGKILTGLLQLVTGGGFLIWWLIDVILILAGSFKDSDGKVLDVW